ncbi:PA14 domain-containing protein [Streptomyces sp. NBC_01262]|uniref:PA14 domain-containing protein n=1 Tax=Streptomyces sp. NBC_01262 TaxID=2903803 RepID=UPI002E369EA2|nr:PA14 domain-containing protein [Streptomyces sp. NBC_01262]
MRMHNRSASTVVLSLAVAAAGLVPAATAAQAATSAISCGSQTWKASYYANTTFKGSPKKTVCDTTTTYASIKHDYGTGDPAGVSLPKDNFGVRWTITRDFGSGGPFAFTTAVRDGVRVYLDGTRKINLWKDVTKTQKKTVNVTIPKGKHTLRVDFAAFKGKANIAFGYAPRTSASVDKVKPLVPTGLDATYFQNGSAGLTWTGNVELDLAGYRVYRRPSTDTTWTRVSGSSPVKLPAYTDQAPLSGLEYVYAVTAVDKAGNESAKSATDSVVTKDLTAPAVPTGLSATYDDDTAEATLTWNANTEADLAGYQVHFRTGSDGPWTAGPWVTATSYTTTPTTTGETYEFAITAFDKVHNYSAKSPVVSVVSRDDVHPVAITDLTATVRSDLAVKLSWTMPTPRFATMYFVYRSTTSPVAITVANRVKDCYQSTDGVPAPCTDTNVPLRGVTYYYAVTVVNLDENIQSAASNEASVALPADTATD